MMIHALSLAAWLVLGLAVHGSWLLSCGVWCLASDFRRWVGQDSQEEWVKWIEHGWNDRNDIWLIWHLFNLSCEVAKPKDKRTHDGSHDAKVQVSASRTTHLHYRALSPNSQRSAAQWIHWCSHGRCISMHMIVIWCIKPCVACGNAKLSGFCNNWGVRGSRLLKIPKIIPDAYEKWFVSQSLNQREQQPEGISNLSQNLSLLDDTSLPLLSGTSQLLTLIWKRSSEKLRNRRQKQRPIPIDSFRPPKS